MDRSGLLRLMANYNEWMNAKVYKATGELSHEAFASERGAYFGSIRGTLNHLVIADTIWLKRFALHPSGSETLKPVADLEDPDFHDLSRYADLPTLEAHRTWLDSIISAWSNGIAEGDLDVPVRYADRKGRKVEADFFALAMHFFNHQTHHRGQITTLLSQAGADVGVTDLLALVYDPKAG